MTAINTTDLTTGTLPGTGTFDQLMVSIEARLIAQFDEQRISGADYANVFMQSMSTAMQQSIQFLLSKQRADKEADLLTEQILLATQQLENLAKEGDLLTKQATKLDSEIAKSFSD